MNAFQLQEQRMDITSFHSPLLVNGFQSLSSNEIKNIVCDSQDELSEFQSFWNDLETDSFMADGGTYRLRRFGVFTHCPTQELMYIGNYPFFQDSSVNVLNGGSPRQFAPLKEGFQQNALLRKLISYDIALLPTEIKSSPLSIYVHQIRILASKCGSGKPTPEGIHQDGHLFVAQHLINRKFISGGESTIYDLDKKSVFQTTLNLALDTLLVNDPKVFHSVSAIKSTKESGYRDMLLIDFNLLSKV